MATVEPDVKSKKETLGLFRELSEHAQSQIDRAWKAYVWLASSLGLIISVGLILFYFMYGDSFDSLEKKIQYRMNIIQKQVEKRIDNEFATQNIRELIPKQA
jgi:hypothetical protein